MQKSFCQGVTSKGLLVEAKVCLAVLIACKHHPLSLNKRYLRYGGTFDFQTDLKQIYLYNIYPCNKVKMPNTEINRIN